ncbi:hypothetical protein PSEUDO8Z_160428 [Pseudomonas sp. 8Z]|nr:hypothetical protein PSEUDO8Z_160428 [Pseudomonas sp. 8Z]
MASAECCGIRARLKAPRSAWPSAKHLLRLLPEENIAPALMVAHSLAASAQLPPLTAHRRLQCLLVGSLQD